MKKWTFFLALGTSLLLSGCFNIFEEIKFNADGSGTYSLKMDMSSLLSDEFMKGMFEEAMKENEQTKGLSKDMEMDSVIYLKNLPADRKAQIGRPDLWNSAEMQIKMSETSKEFFTDIRFKFKSTDDIAFFFQHFDALMAEGEVETLALNPNEFLPGGGLFKFEKKTLTRLPAPPSEKTKEEQESMEMMRMFFSDSYFTTTYYLPGDVQKATMAGAEISSNKVVVKTPMLDVMDGKGKADGQIRFK